MHKSYSASPGPGAYHIPEHFGHGSRAKFITFKGKHFDGIERDENPGPARYNMQPTNLSKGPSFSMGSKPKRRLVTEDVPGPKYDVQKAEDLTKVKLYKSMAARFNLPGSKDEVPGPGFYDMPKSYQNSQPNQGVSYSLTGRHEPRVSDESAPGPGAYNITWRPDQLGYHYSFRGRYDGISKKDFVPGPGTYDPSIRGSRPSGAEYSLARRYLQFSSQFANTRLANEFKLRDPPAKPIRYANTTNYRPEGLPQQIHRRQPQTARA